MLNDTRLEVLAIFVADNRKCLLWTQPINLNDAVDLRNFFNRWHSWLLQNVVVFFNEVDLS